MSFALASALDAGINHVQASLRRCEAHRSHGSPIRVGIVARGKLVARGEVPSQYAARAFARDAALHGFVETTARCKQCPDCDLVLIADDSLPTLMS